MPEVGVIALLADEWGQEWMSRHQILTRLGNYFHVIWVNPSLEWEQALRGKKPKETPNGHLPPGFHVYEAESWLPKFYRLRSLAKYTFWRRLEHARRLLLNKGCQKIILYIWRPEFSPALDAINFDLSCYHVVDEYSFSEVDLPNTPVEQQLLGRVDQVFVHTTALLEKKGSLNPCIEVIPNGVDFESFSTSLPEPEQLRNIPRPRIGYAGYLKKTLDWNLISDLSLKHPDYSFVFVGLRKNEDAVSRAIETLSRRANMHFLGRITTEQMPSFPQHFDVCIMPYLVDGYTKYVYPLKLHEYLASGRPVVASATRLLLEFDGIIQVCKSLDEWSGAISRALLPGANSPEARNLRQDTARKHDWDLLVRSVARVFCRRLGLSGFRLPEETASPERSAVSTSKAALSDALIQP